MAENEQQRRQDHDEGKRRPSSTSPLGGRTHEATRPPGQGEVDEEAVEKGWDALDRAGGGH